MKISVRLSVARRNSEYKHSETLQLHGYGHVNVHVFLF